MELESKIWPTGMLAGQGEILQLHHGSVTFSREGWNPLRGFHPTTADTLLAGFNHRTTPAQIAHES